jgi:hypothetical protein
MRAQQQSKRVLWLATPPSVGARNADTRFAIVQSPRRSLLALMGPTLNAKIDGTSAAFVGVAMKSARFYCFGPLARYSGTGRTFGSAGSSGTMRARAVM